MTTARRKHPVRRWGLPALLALALAIPAAAQYPAAECAPLVPAPAPDDASVLTYCADNPAADCDLAIDSWNPPTTHRSPALRIGDAFNPVGPTPAEQPRVFLDPGNPAVTTDDRLYTKLYVWFRNAGGGPGGGGYAAAGAVSVDFAYKEVADAASAVAAAAVPTGWTEAGTVTLPGPPATIDNTYVMDVASPGVLVPSATHVQQRGVCWTLDAMDPDFPKKFVLRATVIWPSDEDLGNNTAFSFYDLTGEGRRAQIAFALDLSGSMNTSFGASTRLTVAKQKAALFTSLIEDDDQLGVFGFNTGNAGNTPFATSYNDPPVPVAGLNETSVIAPMQTLAGDFQRGVIAGQIDTQTAHGCTPVGQGLLRARQAILSTAPPPGTPAKAIVLFSDGVQNVRPFVNALSYDCGGGTAGPIIDATETFADDGIQIYSIYFGPEIGWAYSLMNDLKDQTGGDYLYGAADELQLAVAYFSIRGLVDDMIFLREKGTVSAGPGAADSTFEVEFDAAAQTATAALTWPFDDGRTRLTLERRQKGTDPWLPCPAAMQDELRPTNPGRADSYVVCRFTPGADSTWQFRVRQASPQRGSTDYSAAVFSLVQTAQIHAFLDDEDFTAGDALTLHTELRTAGQPLTGATVTARVRVPSRPFSTTLQRYSDQLSAPASAGDSAAVTSLASQLSKLLVASGESGDLYLYRSVPVTLTDDGQGADRVAGDGHYTGVLAGSDTRVAGDYGVEITARATLAGGRQVERIARLSTLANVGPADPQATRVTVALDPDLADGARLARVTVVPFDRFGNAAFPGSGSRLAFSGDGATALGDLADNLDASFTQTFRLDRDDARVTVSFDGAVVRSDLPLLGGVVPGAKGKREASFHLGVAVPHGAFGSVYSNGGSAAVDYAWLLGGSFAVKAELALDRFDSSLVDDGELSSLSLYLQHRGTAGVWEPYFESALGVYDLDGVGTALGVAAGLGAQRPLSPHWSLDFNLQRHWVGGSLNFSFSRARVGVIYEF